MRKRSTRLFRSSLFAAIALALPMATPPIFAFAFENDTTGGGNAGDTIAGGAGDDGGGNAGGGAAGNGGGANPPRAKRTYDEQQFSAATRSRDTAKNKLRSIIRALGRDPDEVTFEETDDPENPFTVVGLEDVIDAASKASGEAGGSEAKKKAEADKKRRILAPVQRELATEQRKNAALVDWINKNAIVAPIRAACRDEHIVDDDNGKFDDVVSLLKPRFKVAVYIDDDDKDAPADVTITAMADEGDEQIADATGDPWQDARKMVAELARKRPKFRQSEFRGGPGAGGQRVGANGNSPRSAGTVTTDSKRTNLVRNVTSHYGVRPEEIGEAPAR